MKRIRTGIPGPSHVWKRNPSEGFLDLFPPSTRLRVSHFNSIPGRRRKARPKPEPTSPSGRPFQLALGFEPIQELSGMVWVDDTGAFLQWGERFLQLLKYSPFELQRVSLFQLIHPQDAYDVRVSLQQFLQGKNEMEAIEARFKRRDGWELTLRIQGSRDTRSPGMGAQRVLLIEPQSFGPHRPSPIPASSAVTAPIQCRRDLDLLPEAVFIMRGKRVEFVNKMGLTLLRATDPSEILGHSLQEFLHSSISENDEIDQHILKYQLKKMDGTRIDVECNAAAFQECGKSFVHALVREITPLQIHAKVVRSAREQCEEASREASRHVRKQLRMLINMFRRQAGVAKNPEMKLALAEVRSRVMALAIAHERLNEMGPGKVDLADYLSGLIGDFRESMYLDRSNGPLHQFETSFEPVAVSGDQAISCGLILTELILNALKHAFLPGKVGTIRIQSGALNSLAWIRITNTGRGLPGHQGDTDWEALGSKFVFQQINQLQGVVQLSNGPGGCFEFTFPLPPNRDTRNQETAQSRV